MENSGIEPLTSCVQSRRSPSWANSPDKWYIWWVWMDSNHRPHPYQGCALTSWATNPIVKSNNMDHWKLSRITVKTILHVRFFKMRQSNEWFLVTLRKEVIQPQVLLRLPCYDFTPVANSTVSGSQFGIPISGEINSHGVTGGEYKTRERIHRSIADLRLLVIPASCSRVAENNPNWETL